MSVEPKTCPWCGGTTVYKHDGIFRWRICRRVKTCGWTVFKTGFTRDEWRAA